MIFNDFKVGDTVNVYDRAQVFEPYLVNKDNPPRYAELVGFADKECGIVIVDVDDCLKLAKWIQSEEAFRW